MTGTSHTRPGGVQAYMAAKGNRRFNSETFEQEFGRSDWGGHTLWCRFTLMLTLCHVNVLSPYCVVLILCSA